MRKLFVLSIILLFNNIYCAEVALYNHAKEQIAVKIDVKGAADESTKINPLCAYKLNRIIGAVQKLVINGKEFRVSDGKRYSYDTDTKANFVLTPDQYGYSKPFSFIAAADVHAIATPSTMDAWIAHTKKWVEESKQPIPRSKPADDIKKVKAITDYITNKGQDKNIRACIMPGDLVYWNADPAIEFEAFKEIFYAPISLALAKIGGRLFANAGNHDQYGGHTTPIMKWIETTYGDFYYTFNIHGVHFIVLGMTLAPAKISSFLGNLFPEVIDRDGGSLEFLENDLKHVPQNVPVVIVVHFPPTDTKWMKSDISEHISYACPLKAKDEKWLASETDEIYSNIMDRFYKALENHTVAAIISGHKHEFKDFRTPVGHYRLIIVGLQPVLLSWDTEKGFMITSL